MLLQATGSAWLALEATSSLPYDRLIAPLLISGCGISMAMPSAQKAVVSAVAPAEIGQASGAFNMLRQLGAAFGIALCAAVFTTRGSYASAAAFTDGFTVAMWATAGLALVGALAGAAVRRAPTEDHPSAAEGAGRRRREVEVGG